MITQDTLFILGAGASCPYGLPTGRELREFICKEFPSIVFKYICKKDSFTRDVYLSQKVPIDKFVDAFKDSSTSSIDQFLAVNPSFSEIGKIAICASILEKEKESKFREDCNERKKDWYFFLWQKIKESLNSPNSYKLLKNSKFKFITFNYDRSLEYFLYTSIINFFYDAKLEDKVKNKELILEDVFPFEILHVYGMVAPLLWQDADGLDYRIEINQESTNVEKFLKFKDNITTIHEVKLQNDKKIKEAIAKATKIFFLGFGYADENLKAIGLPGLLDVRHIIHGTAHNYSTKEILDVCSKLRVLSFGEKIAREVEYPDNSFKSLKIKNMDCCSLLNEYL